MLFSKQLLKKLNRIEKNRLARECAKLDPEFEQSLSLVNPEVFERLLTIALALAVAGTMPEHERNNLNFFKFNLSILLFNVMILSVFRDTA